MTKFNPKTLTNLVLFSHRLANQLAFGLKHGLIGHSNKDKNSEIREFLRKYKTELSRDHRINVSNILKTPKQLNYVTGAVECELDAMMA